MGLFDKLRRRSGTQAPIPEAFWPLAEDLASLDEIRSGLGEAALRFVAFGDDDKVLETLASRDGGAKALDLKNVDRSPIKERPRLEFFAQANPAADVLLRFCQVCLACFRRETFYRHLPGELPPWFEILLWESFTGHPRMWSSASHFKLSAGQLLACLEREGETDPVVLARLALEVKDAKSLISGVRRIEDIGVCFDRYPHTVDEALASADAAGRCEILETIAGSSADATHWASTFVEMAVGTAKTVRRAAGQLIHRIPDATERLESFMENGSVGQRIEAATLLFHMGGDRGRTYLNAMTPPQSKKLAQHLESLLGKTVATIRDEPEEVAFEIPARSPIDHSHVTPEVAAAFDRLCDNWLRAASRGGRTAMKPISGDDRAAILESVSEPEPWTKRVEPTIDVQNRGFGPAVEAFSQFRKEVPLTLVQTLRIMYHIGLFGGTDYFLAAQVVRSLGAKPGAPSPHDLRDVAEVLSTMGVPRHRFALHVLDSWRSPVTAWGTDTVWPFFAENLDVIEAALGVRPDPRYKFRDYMRLERRRNCYDVLRCFPTIPPPLLPGIWEVALGSGKTERPCAQLCLHTVLGRDDKIIAALSDGKQDTRAVAATWLGELGVTAAVDPLRQAMKKEKSDLARAAILDALEVLGADLEEFIDPGLLADQAAKGLKKGLPKDLVWFDFAALPATRWKGGEEVDPEIVRWWIVQSHKLKNPEPSALLTRYFQRLDSDPAAELAENVLRQWIGHDTQRPDGIDSKTRQQLKSQVGGWKPYFPGKTPEEVYAWLEQNYLNEPVGSAIKQKGILALVGAGGQGSVVAPVEQYLKTWYGIRAPQCKALLHALAHVDHPAAIQLLLAISVRFRTKGIRKAAEELVRAVAERRGWTLDELADRTIPTAGLDDDGVLILEYGRPIGNTDEITVTRVFRVTMGDDFKVVITREDGTVAKSLPNAGKNEDESVTKRAKKELSATKRQLKDVVRLQTGRLFEAMATQRPWPYSEWKRYLLAHPIAGRLCQRLIWTAFEGERCIGTFRPLDDGSLTDARDDEVQLPAGATLQVAHGTQLSAEDEAAWLQHVADYEVETLFTQLGRGGYELSDELSDENRDQTSCRDFEGHMTKAFALRGAATKLGYTRGEAEDGGWFYRYVKHFPSLELEAEIEFTGNMLPEEDRDVALCKLTFQRRVPHEGSLPVTLGELPPVLLSECWNDLRTMADTGPGFDPEWETKSES